MDLKLRIVGPALIMALTGCMSNAKLGLYRFDQGDYGRAAPDLKQAAAEGNAEAEVDLGYLAQYGLNVVRDEQAAEQLFEQAMSHGSVRAETCLAVLYLQGNSIPHDYEKAIALLKDADVRGDPFATDDLAFVYVEGLGVPVDKELAKHYMGKTHSDGDDEIARYTKVMLWRVYWNRKYPPGAVKSGHTGKNTVDFAVDDMRATDVKIAQSSGYDDLDQASIDAVESTDFPPPPAGLVQVPHFSVAFSYGE